MPGTFLHATASVAGAATLSINEYHLPPSCRRRVLETTTPLSSADTIRSVQTTASTPDQPRWPWVSAPCLDSSALTVLLCSGVDIAHPPSCPAFPRTGSCCPVLQRSTHRRGSGTMRASDSWRARRPLCLLCFAVRASRPQSRHGPGHHHLIHVGVAGRLPPPRLRHGSAGSPHHDAEAGSSSCGLLVRLRMLPTPHRCDAVAFGCMWRDLT